MTRHDFLRALHPSGYHDLRALEANTRTLKATKSVAAPDLDAVEQFVQHYCRRWDIFTGVATRADEGRNLASCLTLYALFADLDFKGSTEADVRARLAAFPLPPSIVVHSGGGLHCYWLLDTPLDLRNGGAPPAKRLLKALMRTLGADPRCVDVAHILRLPGTLNHKYDPPRPVESERVSATAYPLTDILVNIEPLEPESPDFASATPPQVRVKEKIRQAREFLIRQKPAIEGQGGDAYTYNICCFMVNGFDLTVDDAFTALGPWNEKCEPPWLEAGLREKLRNADRYSTGIRGSLLEPERPRIWIRGGDLAPIVDAAESALLAAKPKVEIYQRGLMLTRPVKRPQSEDADGVRHDAGSLKLLAVTDVWLLERMSKTAWWIQKTNKGAKRIEPPSQYVRTLMARAGDWRFPVLRGVVLAPTLASNGRIIETPGYDPRSELLLDFPSGLFPPVPQEPTLDDARAALAALIYPLRGFPFVNDAAKSVAISAMLTGLIRPSLRTAPLHGYDAPTAGTGKSKLAEMVGLLATGSRPSALSQGKSEEEDLKILSSVLFAGDPVIHIDNCERELSGDFLCSMLTQEELQARILGKSEMRNFPSTSLVLASGNNLAFMGDVTRRVVVCRLDAQMERPDTRTFDFDCYEDVRQARPELVVAGLTILRAYHLAGRSAALQKTLQPMGGFEDWAWIRGALVWLGCADPAETRLEVVSSDPVKNELRDVMSLWEDSIGLVNYIEVGDIDKRAETYVETGPDGIETREAVIKLRDKFVDLCCKGKWSSKNVGWWLRKNKGRIVNGLCFSSIEKREKQHWILRRPEQSEEKP